jgi:diacylglycerol kinase (ATP)
VNLVFIINPAAGRWRQRWDAESLHRVFRPLGIEITAHVTKGRGDAETLAKRLADDVGVVCIVGGDGTVHEVVNGLMPRRVPVAVIPAGAGNDLASLLDCPRTPEELAGIIEAGLGADLDLIDFGDRYCVNSAGLGFEGAVNRISHRIARVGGRTRYALALVSSLRQVWCPSFTILTSRGDEIRGEKLLVSVGNGHRTGGAFYLTPDAFPDDGLIDLCVVEPMSRPRMLWVLPQALSGRHALRPEVRMFRAESFTVEATSAYPMHIDGEFVAAGPERREIAIRPAAITVLSRRSRRNRLLHDLTRVI